MEALRVLMLLIALFSCAHGYVEFTQPVSMIVKPGQSLTVSCKVSGFSVTDNSYSTAWVRQPAGETLEYIGNIWGGGNTFYKESLKTRFSMSKDASSNTVSLQGKTLQTEDTAVYYCAQYRGRHGVAGAFDYWGKGTKVTVGADLLPSYIYPLHQYSSKDSSGGITLGCIASGFSPLDALNFTWNDGCGNILPDFHQYPPVMISGSTMMVSHITVKAADWNNLTSYRCAAHHQALGTETSETLHTPDLPCRLYLDVTLKPPRVKEMFKDNTAVLECVITGEDKAVKEAEMIWMLDGVQVTDKITQTGPEKAGHLFRKSSILTLAVEDWEGGKTVKCSVQQKGGPAVTKTLSFGQKGPMTHPTVSIQTPSPEDLNGTNEFFLVCLVTGFYPEEIYIMWQKDNEEYEEGITGEPIQNEDKYSVTSLFRVSKVDWDSGSMYSCSARQASKEGKQIPALSPVSKLTVLSSRSSLDVTLKPPRVKEFFKDKRAVLECIITGEYKAVKEAEIWMLADVKVTDKINQTSPEKADHLFRKSSILTLETKDLEGGKTVNCSVQQKGGPAIIKTLRLGQNGTTKPTVSIQTPSPEVINGTNEFFLVCLVTGFYPEEIYIIWQVDEGEYKDGITGELLKTGDKYSVTSAFRVTEEDWNKGKKYTCNARHATQNESEIPALNPVQKLKVPPPEQESPPDPALSCNEGGEEEDEFSSLWSTAFSFIILFLFSLVYSAFLSLIKAKQ